MIRAIALALALLASISCNKNGDDAPTTPDTEPAADPMLPPGTPPVEAPKSAAENAPPLVGTEWHLVELNGAQVPPAQGGSASSSRLQLQWEDQKFFGFSGCNRFFGTYELVGSLVTFGNMGATRMACPTGMDQEREVLTALRTTTRYEIKDTQLRLFREDQCVASFRAGAP